MFQSISVLYGGMHVIQHSLLKMQLYPLKSSNDSRANSVETHNAYLLLQLLMTNKIPLEIYPPHATTLERG